jgi:hypothetical protein
VDLSKLKKVLSKDRSIFSLIPAAAPRAYWADFHRTDDSNVANRDGRGDRCSNNGR